MPRCEKFKTQLALYANGELPAKQRERVAAHLALCPSCRAEVEAYRQLAERMHDLPSPTIPEHALRGFTQAIMDQIAPRQRRRPRAFDFISHLFRPRWRYAWATAAMVALMFVLGLWYVPLEREGPPARKLAPLLQARAWDKLYYGLLEKETRALLLHEPVPTELLKTALVELLKKGERDLRMRAGLQRLLSAVTGRGSKLRDDSPSAKIMGVITARGYIPAPRKLVRGYDANVLLRELAKLPDGAEVTLAEIVNEKD